MPSAARLSSRGRWIVVIALLLAAGFAWWALTPAPWNDTAAPRALASHDQTTAGQLADGGAGPAPEGTAAVDENVLASTAAADAGAAQPEATATTTATSVTDTPADLPADSAHAVAASDEERRVARHWHRCASGATHSGYRFRSDSASAVTGARSASIESLVPGPSPATAGYCQHVSAAAFRGRRIMFGASLRTLNVMPGAHLVIRADAADGRVVAFANMFDHYVPGTSPWTRQAIVIDIPEEAAAVMVGVLLMNTGKAWIDDATLEVVDASWPLTQTGPMRRSGFNAAPYVAQLPPGMLNGDFEQTIAAPRGDP